MIVQALLACSLIVFLCKGLEHLHVLHLSWLKKKKNNSPLVEDWWRNVENDLGTSHSRVQMELQSRRKLFWVLEVKFPLILSLDNVRWLAVGESSIQKMDSSRRYLILCTPHVPGWKLKMTLLKVGKLKPSPALNKLKGPLFIFWVFFCPFSFSSHVQRSGWKQALFSLAVCMFLWRKSEIKYWCRPKNSLPNYFYVKRGETHSLPVLTWLHLLFSVDLKFTPLSTAQLF